MSKNTKTKEKKDSMIKDALILFVITLVAALLLGFVYEITKEPIANAQAAAKTKAYQTVFPELAEARESEELNALVEGSEEMLAQYEELTGSSIDEALIAYDTSGNAVGYVMTVTNSKGYGGAIQMAMGVALDGKLTGLEFLSISETAGLGMKAKGDDFKSQFSNVYVTQFSLEKAKISGDVEVDAISSATVTTSAVTRGVNAGLRFAAMLLEQNTSASLPGANNGAVLALTDGGDANE